MVKITFVEITHYDLLFLSKKLLSDHFYLSDTSNLTQKHLLNNGVRLLKQPPYSPDCNLCDGFFFDAWKPSERNLIIHTKEELEIFLQYTHL